jgi:GT2 family glycosyltransferase/glycosyltransferase involved in cell wall biosynthesis
MPSPTSSSSVDVIVPNWNGARCLHSCLASLVAQTHPSFRVVVVDNGSTDDSPNIVREQFPQVSLIEVGRNSGFAAAVNRGIRATTGDYVALLNNDAVAAPDWVARLAQALDADASLGSCASRMLVQNKPSLINLAGLAFSPSLRACSIPIGWGALDSYEHHVPCLVAAPSGGAAMYRRAALDQVGLFDEDYFLYYEDFDLGLRLQLGGYDCLYVPDAVVYHDDEAIDRQHPDWIVRLNRRNSRWTALKCLPKPLLAGLALRHGRSLRAAFSEPDELIGPGAPPEALVPPSKSIVEKREEVRSRSKIGALCLMRVLAQRRRPYRGVAAPTGKFSVALVSHSAEIAGAEHCTLRLAKGLDAARLRPIVVVPSRMLGARRPGPLTEELRKADIEFVSVFNPWWCTDPALPTAVRLGFLALSLRAGWRVKRLLRDTGVEAVGTMSSVVPGGAIAALLAGVRHVWHVREPYPMSTLRPTLGMAATLKLVNLMSSAVVVPSRNVAALFPGAGKVQVVPEGIDARFFDTPKLPRAEARGALGIPSDSRVLALVGAVDPRKDVIGAIRALARLVARGLDVCLVLCGKSSLPDYERQVRDEATALSVSDRVRFTGFLRDVIPVYDASDVLMVTSLRESFGLTIVEAMARAVPVVATRCGGPEELIADGETGFLVPVGDTEAMADRIAVLLENDAVNASVVERARAFATRFHPAENLEKTLRSYGFSPGG